MCYKKGRLCHTIFVLVTLVLDQKQTIPKKEGKVAKCGFILVVFLCFPPFLDVHDDVIFMAIFLSLCFWGIFTRKQGIKFDMNRLTFVMD